MLIEKKYQPSANDVISVLLSTGQEVVGRFISQDDKSVTISKPIVITRLHGMGGELVGAGMEPYMVSSEGTVNYPISLQHIMTVVKTGGNVLTNYMSATSGLAIPPQAPANGLISGQ